MSSSWQPGMVAYCSSCGFILGEDSDDRANLSREICPKCGMDPGDPKSPAEAATGFWMSAVGFKTSASVWWKPWTRGRTIWEIRPLG
jgi:hypothetical protein